MDDTTFWNNIWKYATIAFCVLVVCSFASCQASKYQIRKSVEAGATAMEAACAFDHGNVSDGSLCAITLIEQKAH